FAVAPSPSPSSSGGRGVSEASNLINQAIIRLSPLTRFTPAGFLLLRQKRTPMTKLDFDRMQRLIPAVLQEADSGEVLMLGFMNPAALVELGRTVSPSLKGPPGCDRSSDTNLGNLQG